MHACTIQKRSTNQRISLAGAAVNVHLVKHVGSSVRQVHLLTRYQLEQTRFVSGHLNLQWVTFFGYHLGASIESQIHEPAECGGQRAGAADRGNVDVVRTNENSPYPIDMADEADDEFACRLFVQCLR